MMGVLLIRAVLESTKSRHDRGLVDVVLLYRIIEIYLDECDGCIGNVLSQCTKNKRTMKQTFMMIYSR